MFRNAVLCTALFGIVATPALADSGSKEEAAGLGLGTVVGAAAGGPVGAFVGAALGAVIGNSYHDKKQSVEILSGELQDSRGTIADLQSSVASLQREAANLGGELAEARELNRPEMLALLQSGIEMDLLFRTDEHVLTDGTGQRLAALAASLKSNPDIRVRVDGFADERGDEEYNRKLSGMRASYVRDLLVANGVEDSRITVNARGESEAKEKSADSFALERRVSLTIYVDGIETVASTPSTP